MTWMSIKAVAPEATAPSVKSTGSLCIKSIKDRIIPGNAACPMASPISDCPLSTVIQPTAPAMAASKKVPLPTMINE